MTTKDNNDVIIIEDFAHPTHQWKAKNDTVMRGKSTSTVTIQDGLGIFDGEVVDVPFLQAPGFVTMETRGGVYPDVSTCQGLSIRLRAITDEPYHGYRLSFGNVHVPGGRFAYGYKADFEAPLREFDTIYIPFDKFTAKWDDATGNAIVTCEEDAQYCPTPKSLQNLQQLVLWGEGVTGKVHLEIASIAAANCAAENGVAGLDDTLTEMMPEAQWTTLENDNGGTAPGVGVVSLLASVVLLVAIVKLIAWRKRTKNYTPLPNDKVAGQELVTKELATKV